MPWPKAAAKVVAADSAWRFKPDYRRESGWRAGRSALDQGQKDKLASLEATQIDRQAMADLSQEDRQKKVAEIRAGDLKKVDEILKGPQRERLAEIMLQLEGVRALGDRKSPPS